MLIWKGFLHGHSSHHHQQEANKQWYTISQHTARYGQAIVAVLRVSLRCYTIVRYFSFSAAAFLIIAVWCCSIKQNIMCTKATICHIPSAYTCWGVVR